MSSGGGAAGCRLPAASAGGSDAGGSAAAVGPRSGLGAAKARELDCDPAGKTLPRAPSWSRGPPPRLGWPFPAIRAAYLQTLVLFPFPPFLTSSWCLGLYRGSFATTTHPGMSCRLAFLP